MELNLTQPLSSISVIFIVRDSPLDFGVTERLLDVLGAAFADIETVIIANGVSAAISLELKKASERLPDCTVLFLTEEVHDDIARLLGIDHAISDHILFATPLQSQIDALPELIESLRQGNDVVIGEGDSGVVMSRGPAFTAMFNLFRYVHRIATGRSYEALSPAFRAYSRAAALYIATRRDGEVLIRARALGQGFPSATVATRSSVPVPIRSMSFRMAVSKAVRLLLTGSSVPLRLSSYLGFGGGIMSVIYAVYVVLIYLFKKDVEPGWTTLSLQLAGMMFLFSTQFLFLSEYLVQILSTSPAVGRRQLVARELRGTISRQSDRLNVVGREGRFYLGAPQNLIKPGADE
jgi:polyisoprenyl-phosphate glycosyltransferase